MEQNKRCKIYLMVYTLVILNEIFVKYSLLRLNHYPNFGEICTKYVFGPNVISTKNYIKKLHLVWLKNLLLIFILQINGSNDFVNICLKKLVSRFLTVEKLLTYLNRGFSQLLEVLGSNLKDKLDKMHIISIVLKI